MTPEIFPQATHIMGKGQSEYLPLHTHVAVDIPERTVTSRWRLTFWERIVILFTGRLWLQQLSFGAPLQPQKPSVRSPFGAGFEQC